MPRLRLDQVTVMSAICPAGKRKLDLYDVEIQGFIAEIRSSGGKTYYLRFTDENQRLRQIKIASCFDITCSKARRQAEKLRSEVVLGGNPAAEKKARRAVPTYAELAEKHLTYIKGQRSFKTTEAYFRLHLLPRWGKLRLNEIHQTDVAAWLADKKDSGLAPATVLKAKSIFQRSWSLALRWEIPGVTRNPVQGISIGPINNARDRFLSDEEAKRLHKAVAASPNTQLKYIIGLLLLTGARRSELLKAEWRHIDLDNRRWLIPTSKTGKSRYVPLSQAAVDLIGALPRFEKCPYLVPNPKTKKPFVSIKHSFDTARVEAAVADVRIHDLRHSAASFMVNAGIDLHAVGKVLGHANIASTMRYAHLANDTLLKAVEAGSEKLGSWAA